MWYWFEETGGGQGAVLPQATSEGACSSRTLDRDQRLLPYEPKGSLSRRLTCLVGLGITILLFAGCALITPKEELPLRSITAQELTTLLRHREAAIESLKGLFSARVRGGLIPIASRVEGAVYYRRPDALRLRGFTPLGSELFDFVQADDRYKLRLPFEGKTYAGHRSDMKDGGKLARFSQLTVWAVGGVLGTNSIATDEMVTVVEERGRYRLDVYAPAIGGTNPSRLPTRRLWLDRRLLVVQEEWLGSSGDVEAMIQYEDFRPLDESERIPVRAVDDSDVRLFRPFKISLHDGRGPGSVHVIFHEIHHNQVIRAEDLGQVS
jgi:hypothetical protein